MNDENLGLLLAPLTGAAATLYTSATLFGLNPLILGLIVAAIAKAVPSLKNWKSWEDWLLFLIVTFGALYAAFSSDPQYATYGLIAGFFLKALTAIWANGLNVENLILAISTVLSGVAQIYGYANLAQFALLLGIIAKSVAIPPTTTSPTAPTGPPAAPA